MPRRAPTSSLQRLPIVEKRKASSSLKFCLIARGEADLYARLGQTSEWDTAAGQAILAAAGGSVTTLDGRAADSTASGKRASPTRISSPGRASRCCAALRRRGCRNKVTARRPEWPHFCNTLRRRIFNQSASAEQPRSRAQPMDIPMALLNRQTSLLPALSALAALCAGASACPRPSAQDSGYGPYSGVAEPATTPTFPPAERSSADRPCAQGARRLSSRRRLQRGRQLSSLRRRARGGRAAR